MTPNRIILMFAAAFLVCSSGTLKAQAPAETVPNQQADVRTDRDDRDHRDWGWIGLLGLAGLAGLAGRRDVITTRRDRN